LLFLTAALALLLVTLPARAQLVFSETVHHAGLVYTGNPLKHSFSFSNRGPDTATILEARASCGCMAPRLSQKNFNPRELGKLELEVNTLSQAAGAHLWTVQVRYQVGHKTVEAQLQLDANLRTEVSVQPANMVLLVDRAPQHEVTVTDFRSQHLNLTRVQASSPKVKLHVTQASPDDAGHWQCKIRLEAAQDYADGRHEETLQLFTDDPKYPELRVPVTLIRHSQQRVAATPAEVTLTGSPGQPLPSRIVLLRDSNDQPVLIDHIMIDDPAVTCRWAKGPGTLATLRVQIDAKRIQGGTLQSVIHVLTKTPLAQTITVPVQCSIK
jgi:hypothetical protein